MEGEGRERERVRFVPLLYVSARALFGSFRIVFHGCGDGDDDDDDGIWNSAKKVIVIYMTTTTTTTTTTMTMNDH